jgi:hypothetical protein
MSKAVSPHADEIAKKLSAELQGKMDQPKIDAIVTALKTPATAYPCITTIICLVFYERVAVAITGGKSFGGNAGGFCVIPGGTGGGNVYTDDINKLYNNTASFSLVLAAVYCNVIFYDSNSNVLGHAECGGAYTPGGGGGTGSWS